MKHSPLFEVEQKAGAVFGPSGEWEMPQSYGNSISEHLAVRLHAGLADRSHRGKLRLTGKDRVDFLNGLVTNDIKALQSGGGLYTALTTAKAKMLSDCRVYCLPDALMLDLEPEMVEKVTQHLDRYIIASDVTIENLSDSWGLLTLIGPTAPAILAQLTSQAAPPEKEHSIISLIFEGFKLLVSRNEFTGEAGYDLFIPNNGLETLWGHLHQIGAEHGLQPVGLEALDSLRVEAGIPRYGVDMDESHFPMEAGIEKRAISYTKGCYIGQETIARADTYGRMNRRLIGLELSGEAPPSKGTTVTAPGDPAKNIGLITSAVKSPTLGKVIALAYIHRDFTQSLSKAMIGDQSAHVVDLPFYSRPSHS